MTDEKRGGRTVNRELVGDDDGQGEHRRNVTELTSVQFAQLARLILSATGQGVRVTFRSPPKDRSATRAIRHGEDGAIVAVAIRGRNAHAAAADMIDGVMVAWRHQNPGEAPRPGPGGLFDRMWEAAEEGMLQRLVDDESRRA